VFLAAFSRLLYNKNTNAAITAMPPAAPAALPMIPAVLSFETGGGGEATSLEGVKVGVGIIVIAVVVAVGAEVETVVVVVVMFSGKGPDTTKSWTH